MRTVESDSVPTLVEPLTRREAEVLGLLAAGYSRPEIAARLTVTLSSVKFHLQHLYSKLGANSKRQAVSYAQALGLLAPSAPPAAFRSGRAADPGPAPRHNLPLQMTRFFGREGELAQVRARLDENRLVTLTGAGGVGKTRLALRAAEELLPGYTDGVWLVELAPLTDPALVPQQVAASLGLRDEPGQPLLDTLIAYLRARQALLVLDNCEHLLAACAHLSDRLLRACLRVRVLATSREPLGVAGEVVCAVASLAFPAPGQLPPLNQLADYTAIRLFVDRARLVRPDYQAAPHNAAALAHICQLLDGIPLALEMAASRLRWLNTNELAARLDDAFPLLTNGSREAPPRQQTLRATIDWSYALLTPEERQLFQRLSIFAAGFTLAAAEAVCAPAGPPGAAGETPAPPPVEVVEALAALVEKSLVVAERQPGHDTRYRLLETVRQYAREKLAAAGETDRLRARHMDYYVRLVRTTVPHLPPAERRLWVQRYKAERDNIRQVLEWSFSDVNQPASGPQFLLDLSDDQWATYGEERDWYQRAVDWCENHAGISPALHARLLGRASGPVAGNDPYAARPLAERAVALSRALGPAGRELLRCTLTDLAWIYLWGLNAPEQAQPLFAEAEAIFLELAATDYSPERYQAELIRITFAKVQLAIGLGHYPAAKTHASEYLRLAAACADRSAAIGPYWTLGVACLKLGEYEPARGHLLTALRLAEEFEALIQADVLRWLATVDWRQGQLERALDYARASLREAEKIGDRNMIASDLGVCAGIAAEQGQAARAARLSGASAALYARQKRLPWEDSSVDTLLPGWREGPDAAVITAAFEVGQALNVEQAMAFAFSESAA
jgi:predicted ATPase/DNA-binding CsgD family transcriptional regulator